MGENIELKQCSRCHSNILLGHFELNRQGILFKTCNNCRRINRETFNNYRENNTEKELERNKQYRRNNTEILRCKDRERDKIRSAQKNEERKQLVECQCGASITKGWKTSHEKTTKHLEWMSTRPET